MLYYFEDESTGNEVCIEADSHTEAIDIAYEKLEMPAFMRVEYTEDNEEENKNERKY